MNCCPRRSHFTITNSHPFRMCDWIVPCIASAMMHAYYSRTFHDRWNDSIPSRIAPCYRQRFISIVLLSRMESCRRVLLFRSFSAFASKRAFLFPVLEASFLLLLASLRPASSKSLALLSSRACDMQNGAITLLAFVDV